MHDLSWQCRKGVDNAVLCLNAVGQTHDTTAMTLHHVASLLHSPQGTFISDENNTTLYKEYIMCYCLTNLVAYRYKDD